MDLFIKFLPIVSSLILASLGYFFGQKRKRNEQFIKYVEHSLDEVCAPLLYELKKIKNINDSYQKEKLIRAMFDKYTAENSKIHKIGNIYILECFLELEKTFLSVVKDRESKDWIKFNVQFDRFYDMIEEEYWSTITVMYRDYRWFTYNFNKNYYVKHLVNLLRFMYETAKFFVIVWFLGFYFLIYQRIIGEEIFPQYIKEIIVYSFSPVLGLFLFTWMFVMGYQGIVYQKRNIFSQWMRRKFPVFMRFWEGDSFQNPKIDESKIHTPKMYEKNGPFNM